MYNTTIPFKNLMNGAVALIWALLAFINFKSISLEELLYFLMKYRDISIIFATAIVFVSYPLGIVISSFSYYFAKYTFYRLFISRNKSYNLAEHESRIKVLSISSNEEIREHLREKTNELSVLGGSGLNFLIVAIILFFSKWGILVGIFVLCFSVIFFTLAVEKYKSWYWSIIEYYDHMIEERQKI